MTERRLTTAAHLSAADLVELSQSCRVYQCEECRSQIVLTLYDDRARRKRWTNREEDVFVMSCPNCGGPAELSDEDIFAAFTVAVVQKEGR